MRADKTHFLLEGTLNAFEATSNFWPQMAGAHSPRLHLTELKLDG